MKKIFNIRIIGLLILLLGFSYVYFIVNENQSIDTSVKETDLSISSDKLLSSFKVNEIKANTDFIEKTIEVEGSIKKITFTNNRYTVLLQGQNSDSHVICDILPSNMKEANKLRQGQIVRLKGICKGYLLDVIMLNCILITG